MCLAAHMRRNLAIILDRLGNIFAHQFAHFSGCGVVCIDGFKLQPERIELDTELVDYLHRGRGKRGALRFEPQFGARYHLLGIAQSQFGTLGHFDLRKLPEHADSDCGEHDRQHQSDHSDGVHKQTEGRCTDPDRGEGYQNALDPLFPMLRL